MNTYDTRRQENNRRKWARQTARWNAWKQAQKAATPASNANAWLGQIVRDYKAVRNEGEQITVGGKIYASDGSGCAERVS